MTPKELLKRFGFSENESVVYLAVLQLWSTQIGNILRLVSSPRATVYDTIDRLVKGWYLFVSEQSGVSRYGASDPDIFLAKIQADIEGLEQTSRLVSKHLPTMMRMKQGLSHLPTIRTYEGREWIREVLDEYLGAKETIRAYVNADAMKQTVDDIVGAYLKKREGKKIQAKGFVIHTKGAEEIMKGYDPRYTEHRWFPETSVPTFDLELSMFDGKVIYMTYRDTMPIAVVMEDVDMYRLHCAAFDALWERTSSI